jgi:hypothetical protein
VATQDGVGGNDVANGGPAADVYDADPGDLLDDVELERDCWGARASNGTA